jgi:hypothetical protein
VQIHVSDGIIAHLAKERDGNVHHRYVADATYGSFEKEFTEAICHVHNVGDLEAGSWLQSACRPHGEDVTRTEHVSVL